MSGTSDVRRFWSDGHGIYHVATFGERLFASSLDWLVALSVGSFLGSVVTVTYVVRVSEPDEELDWYVFGEPETGGIFLFWPVMFVFATIVHIAFAWMLARRGETIGYHALKLKLKRDNLEPLGLRRCMLRKFVGSPGLILPYVLVVVLSMLFMCLKVSEWLFDTRVDLFGILSDPVLGIWSFGVTTYWIATPILVAVNHIRVNKDAKGRMPHDVMLDILVVQDRILSTNRASFPSTGRAPVERWD